MISRARIGDRLSLLTLALLLLVTAAAWAGVLIQSAAMGEMSAAGDVGGMPAGDMGDMPGMAGDAAAGGLPQHVPGWAGLVAFVGAWAVMMAAMMLPSATPMILLYRTVARGRASRGGPFVPTWIFVLGYLVVWAAFGVPVYLAGRAVGLLLAGDMRLVGLAPYGVAAVLLAAGAYQFTPLKRVCLRACQGPLGFLLGHWRPGTPGALRMGLEHGVYCLGCCWGLMAVLVAAGAMGLAWVLLIALAVAAEKLLPRAAWPARVIGVALLGLGVLVAALLEMALVVRP